MSNASIRIEQLMLPTYPEPGKEEMPLFAEYRVHQRSIGFTSVPPAAPIPTRSFWK